MVKLHKKKTLPDKNFLTIPDISKKKKNERGKYLRKRINDLFENLETWIEGTDFDMKREKILVDTVNLPSAEIFLGNKSIAALKPNGLWGFGVNCQIEIEAGKETNYIFDIAEESSMPDWELVYRSGKPPKKLSKIIFRNLLKRVSKSVHD
jgi:hypothetical protein